MGKFLKNLGNSIKGGVKNTQQAIDEAKRKAEKAIRDAERKRNEALAKAQRDAKERAERAKEKVQDALKKIKLPSPKDAKYVMLVPFLPLMKQMLNQRNITHNGMLHDVAPKFLVHVVNRGNIKQAPKPSAVLNNIGSIAKNSGIKFKYDEYGVANYFADEEATYTESGSTASQYEQGAKETKNIIQKIIAWFQERKAKKKAKEEAEAQAMAEGTPMPENYGDLSTPPLTGEEDSILANAEVIAGQINNSIKDEVETDESFSTVEIILGLLGIGLLIYGATKVFGGKKA